MYEVHWLQGALDDLTTIWLEGDSVLRQAITLATNALDNELARVPFQSSESREENERVLFAYPPWRSRGNRFRETSCMGAKRLAFSPSRRIVGNQRSRKA